MASSDDKRFGHQLAPVPKLSFYERLEILSGPLIVILLVGVFALL